MTPNIALSLAAILALAACATDGETSTDTAGTPVALTGLDTTFGNAGVRAVPLAATDGDRLVAVAASSGGTYASGYVTQADDQSMALVRLDASGAPTRASAAVTGWPP